MSCLGAKYDMFYFYSVLCSLGVQAPTTPFDRFRLTKQSKKQNKPFHHLPWTKTGRDNNTLDWMIDVSDWQLQKTQDQPRLPQYRKSSARPSNDWYWTHLWFCRATHYPRWSLPNLEAWWQFQAWLRKSYHNVTCT
jgi:hypothetical protein